ncbi:hypothetical protein FE257_011287 [Aspergillus nanangensis]|uniref:Uncharacterized protein n=1 Tax=Aspergillus nanangensis TaxID=2582783 RepID=A0AAD4GRK4_ASPNN|nr:hypothetical protein FE257_011287 [Aspergillus nanangensis]
MPHSQPTTTPQPTDFTLDTFTLRDAVDDPSILSAIAMYSKIHLSDTNTYSIPRERQSPGDPAPSSDSVLFLRVRAAADYFSPDPALMETVPPVVADIILDPFLANVFPKSLVPTAGYITVIACLAVVLSWFVRKEFQRAVEHTAGQRSPDGKKMQ